MKPIGTMRSIKTVSDIHRMTQEQLTLLQKQRLHKLVDYARRNSPYWKEKLDALPEDFSLQDLPITRKEDLSRHFDQSLTDPKVTSSALAQFMESPENVGRLFLGKYLPVTTSGTLGKPSLFLWDENAVSFLTALSVKRLDARKDIMRRALKNGGRTAGIQPTNGFFYGYSFLRHKQLKHPLQSGRFRVVPAALSPWEQASMLNRYKPSVLKSSPSFLARLLRDSRERLTCQPAVVSLTGETLFPCQQAALQAALPDCQVFFNYTAVEGGLIASQCSHGTMHLNSDCVILEPVNADLSPTPVGELSWGVLVTNLSNFIQPVIRYLLEDRVRILPEPCPCGNLLPAIALEGRANETLLLPSPDGLLEILPRQLADLFRQLPLAEGFQVIQTDSNALELRLPPSGQEEVSQEAAALALLRDFLAQRQIGEVTVSLSSQPPQVSPYAGKMQPVLRKWHPTVFAKEEFSCLP